MILVTGVSGFIGRHLLASLCKKYGAESVLALTSKPISDCPYVLHNNYSFDSNIFVANRFEAIETIIHAGSYTPKDTAGANNWELCNSNINSTGQLLKAQLPKVKKFIFLSTADVYGSSDVINEASVLDPMSLYAHAKVYTERMVQAWAKDQGKEATILRIGHVYGPGEESYQKVIPLAFKKLSEKKNLQIMGTGEEIRSFLFVRDVVDVMVNGLESGFGAEVVNVASSNPITIKDLYEKLIAISGQAGTIEFVPSTREPRNLIFDNSLMRPLLRHPETSLDEGLQQEWEYMKGLRL